MPKFDNADSIKKRKDIIHHPSILKASLITLVHFWGASFCARVWLKVCGLHGLLSF